MVDLIVNGIQASRKGHQRDKNLEKNGVITRC